MTVSNNAQQAAQDLQAISPPDVTQQLQLLSLPEAARILPTQNGKRISTATLWRWISKGLNGQRLKCYRFGKRISVTVPDLLEFGAAVAEAHGTAQVAAAPARRKPTDKQRERAIRAAEENLKRKGVRV